MRLKFVILGLFFSASVNAAPNFLDKLKIENKVFTEKSKACEKLYHQIRSVTVVRDEKTKFHIYEKSDDIRHILGLLRQVPQFNGDRSLQDEFYRKSTITAEEVLTFYQIQQLHTCRDNIKMPILTLIRTGVASSDPLLKQDISKFVTEFIEEDQKNSESLLGAVMSSFIYSSFVSRLSGGIGAQALSNSHREARKLVPQFQKERREQLVRTSPRPHKMQKVLEAFYNYKLKLQSGDQSVDLNDKSTSEILLSIQNYLKLHSAQTKDHAIELEKLLGHLTPEEKLQFEAARKEEEGADFWSKNYNVKDPLVFRNLLAKENAEVLRLKSKISMAISENKNKIMD